MTGGPMHFDLSSKTAFVAGASSGLGAHFAATLASAGANVILAAGRGGALTTVAQAIQNEGGSCEIAELHVTDASGISGIEPLLARTDVLVNNAGLTVDKPLLEQGEDDWDRVMDTNVKGMFLLTRELARAMKARGRGGAIINVASILGLRQGGRVASYATSKAAVIQLTKVSALELARYGIRVNCLCPGYFATDLNAAFRETGAGEALVQRIPQRRLGEARELDGPLLLLASDASSYMAGSVLVADGGHLTSTL